MEKQQNINILSLINDAINSFAFVESLDVLADRTTEILTQLPDISHVVVSFHEPQTNKIKITEQSITLPILGITNNYGSVEIQSKKHNFATDEIIELLKTITNLVAGVCFRIKQNNDYRILSNIAKETDYSIILTDFNGIIEWVNDGFVVLSEYSLEEVKGKRPSDIMQGVDTDSSIKKRISNAMHLRQEAGMEVENFTKSGKKYWADINIKPLFENGKLSHFIIIQKNISHLKTAEQELKTAKEIAESANEAKDRFLAITSHEIRTPLNIILGMSKILLETELNEIQTKYIRGIKSSSQNLLLIINDLLDISKIQAGKLQLENIEFNIHQVTEDAITFQNLKAKEKGLELRLIKDIRINPILMGDPFRLNQILLNLLTNAIKFTERGSVSLSYQLLSETDTKQTVEIKVCDTGIGIDSKKIDKIFDSYTQEDIAITRKYGGTGLGLTITKELVDLYKGTISVVSDKNTGTCFTLKFTFQKQTQNILHESEYNTHETDNALKGTRILLAEDNEFNQIIALAYLSRWGVETETVMNGKEAVHLLQHKTFDMVLMDIQMPEMDGIAATNAIRNELKLDIPIIALTAHALNYERDEFMKNGLNDYLTKPIDEALLFKTIVRFSKLGINSATPNNKRLNGTSTSTEKKLYDLSDLKKISVSDKMFIPKIIELYIKQSSDIPNKLIELLSAGDYKEIAITIHQIKPSLNHLSVSKAMEMIASIEENIHHDKNSDETADLVQSLIELLKKLNEQLQQELIIQKE